MQLQVSLITKNRLTTLFCFRIAEEKAASQERVSCGIHGDITEELVELECTRIVEEVIR